MEIHFRTTGCRLSYGITQCYLLPDTSERTTLSLHNVSTFAKNGANILNVTSPM